MKTYLSVEQVASYLQIPKSTIYSLWKEFGGVKVGRHIRISREGIDEYLEGLKDGSMVRTGQTSGQLSQPGPRVRQKGRGTGSGRTAEAIIKAGEDPHCPRNFLRSMGGVP